MKYILTFIGNILIFFSLYNLLGIYGEILYLGLMISVFGLIYFVKD